MLLNSQLCQAISSALQIPQVVHGISNLPPPSPSVTVVKPNLYNIECLVIHARGTFGDPVANLIEIRDIR